MSRPESSRHSAWAMIVRSAFLLLAVGVVFYSAENWGSGALSRFSEFVEAHGFVGVWCFIAINALATMLFFPQVAFTVMAGALFGWQLGTVWASLAMTLGAIGAFCLARYGLRDRLRVRFEHRKVFQSMERLSRQHPLHVISFSRLIPVIPFPLASYMLGVTQVHAVPYIVLTWVCMLPETVFLASGGHLLHTGITGKASVEAVAVLGIAGVVLGGIVFGMKKKVADEREG